MIMSERKLRKYYVAQLGEYTCGLACLSTLSIFHGGEVSQEKLRDISGTTTSGTSLLGMIHAAKEIGFEAKGFEADLSHLKELESPVILHVVLDKVREHFVVFFGHQEGKFWVSDPGSGILAWDENTLLEVWKSRVLLQIKPLEGFQTQSGQTRYKWEWFKSLIAEDIPVLMVSAVLGTLMAVTGLSTAIFSQRLIDDFLPNENYQKAILGVIALGVLLLFRSVLGYFQGVFMARQGRDLNLRIVSSFIHKILRLPMKYFKGFSTGDLIVRMNDSLRIKNTVAMITGTVIINLLVVVVSLAFVFYQSLWIGYLCLAGILVFLFTGWYYHRPILEKQKEVMAAHALNETQYVDGLTGIPILRSFGKEEEFGKRIDQVYAYYQDKGFSLAMLGNNFSFFTQIIVAVFTGLLFGIGVYLVFERNLLLGELMSLIQVGSSIIPAVAGLVVANIQLQEAKVAFDRMHEVAGLPVEDNQENGGQSIQVSHTLLSVSNIAFRYPGRSPILKGVSFELQPRESLGLFAPVGTGKSTLVDLIQKFYLSESGVIQLPFLNKENISLTDWRAQLAVVYQKEKIFNSTVLDNIVLSSDPKEIETKVQVMKALGCFSLFQDLSQGLLTLCGEEGRNLSGGQRQMVGLVRALVKQPKILILDEATAAMDYRMERGAMDLIRNYLHQTGAGLLLITHQPTLAITLDRILILEQGKITANDTPQQLLTTENVFSSAFLHILQPKPNLAWQA
jgi:ABC-type bacteriocin/lantibiotic exporter with double-glycine peptidase domain